MPRKASGEQYVWDADKETKFLQQLDDYLALSGGKHPPLATLDLWADQFNAEYGGVPAHGMTLYQKKERMKKIYRGWKALQCRTGLGYDPATDRVICSDETWRGFIKVFKECNHLRHEGLRNKELYYNVFEKNHAAGASGYGSVTMPADSTPYGELCSACTRRIVCLYVDLSMLIRITFCPTAWMILGQVQARSNKNRVAV